MEDDFDLEETSEEVVQEPVVDVAKLQKALEKANKEALDARLELRRTQLEKDYGEEIVGLIPQALPQTEWKDYADKLKAFRGQPSSEAQTDQATQTVSQEEPTEEERKLAAVSEGPSGATSPGGLSPEEVINLAMSDPERYRQLRDGGSISLERLPGSTR